MKSLVRIILGSDSDLLVMADTITVLNEFGISNEISIISAHRNPEGLSTYITTAVSSGAKVFIASAGLAAHLPGVIAAQTILPVIGVPMNAKSSPNGMDALLSIVQMPPGVPVATVGINGARNAGLLAIQILALSDKKLESKLINFKKNLKASVEKKSEELHTIGVKAYLEKNKK